MLNKNIINKETVKRYGLICAVLALSCFFTAEAAVPVCASDSETISWNPEWEYASFSVIHTDSVTLYHTQAETTKGFTVCVNAGHGTAGGDTQYTYCHPDGTPKVTGGSTAQGSVTAPAVSGGMTFADQTPEAQVVLSLALKLKRCLLDNGYDVLMIRTADDVQLDNIARTVFANNCADCHIALHYDSTDSDKGLYYCSVPDVQSYRAMQPVADHYQEHFALGEALVEGARQSGLKIFGENIPTDLTQTSYSTIPSVDLEVGDAGSDHSDTALEAAAEGILNGVNLYYDGMKAAEVRTEN